MGFARQRLLPHTRGCRGTRVRVTLDPGTHCGTQSNFLILLASCHAPTPGVGDERPLPITLCSRPDPGSVHVSHWEQQAKLEETLRTTLRNSQMSRLGMRRQSAGAGSWRGSWARQMAGWGAERPEPHTATATGPHPTRTPGHVVTGVHVCSALPGTGGQDTL